MPLLELVAIRADRLRENLLDYRGQRTVRARQRPEVLELINEPPQLARVRILRRAPLRERARCDQEVVVLAERGLDLLEEMLRQHAFREGVHRGGVVRVSDDAKRRDHVADDFVLDE